MAKKPAQNRPPSSPAEDTFEATSREWLEQALEPMLQQIPTDLWASTPNDNRVIFQSDHSIELWGDFRGRELGELNLPSELIARLQKKIDITQSGETVEYETTLPIEGRQAQIYYNKICPILDENQNTIGVLGVCRDITRQKEEEQLQIARHSLAERLNKASSVEEAMKLCFEATLRISQIKWACAIIVDEEETCRILFFNGIPQEIRDRVHGSKIDVLTYVQPEPGTPQITTPDDYPPPFAAILRKHNISKCVRFSMYQNGRVVAALSIAARDPETIPQWYIDELKIITTQTEAAISRIRTQEENKADQLLLRELFQLQEQERYLLSSEIHDGLIQDIVGAQMVFETLVKIGTDTHSECPKLFAQASEMLGNALKSARSFISDLRPLIIEEAGIIESVNFLINRFDESVQKKIIYTHDENIERFNPIIEGIGFRLIQEGIRNAVLHSQANTIQIHIAENKEAILIDISDNGIGFDPQEVVYKGYGVHRILEKPSLFGGSSKIESEPGKGTKIHIELPVIRMEDYSMTKL